MNSKTMTFNNNVWVIIPAYNESKNISAIIDETKKYCSNIIVVDDGSKDNTFEAAKKTGVKVLRHIINLGKGSAVITGCDFSIKKGAEKIILMDSDGQHNPSNIPLFTKNLEKKDIVFSYRTFSEDMPFILKIGNIIINKFTRLLYGIKLRDTQCGFRAFTSDAYKKIKWKSSDYSMESEMIANAGKHKLRYEEIQIETVYSDKYKGTTIFDGIKIVFNMFSWRLRR